MANDLIADLAPAGALTGTEMVELDTGTASVRTTISALGVFARSGVLNVKDYGAKGDGTTDDTAAIQAALNTAAVSGAVVLFPAGTYITSGSLLVAANVAVRGDGMASIVKYAGTGWAFIGGGTGGSLSYGVAIRDLRILLSNAAGSGITLRGTAAAMLSNLSIERTVVSSSSTGTGIFLDGSNAATIFTRMDRINVQHVKYGYREGTTGSQVSTSVTATACDALTDTMAGSVGFRIDVGSGGGSTYIGGNAESCETGVQTAAANTSFIGMRFEANTTDIHLVSTCRANTFVGCQWITVITDDALDISNQFLGNADSSQNPLPNVLAHLFHSGAVILARNQAGTTYILVGTLGSPIPVATTTSGRIVMQAGNGSGANGGSVILYGSDHATLPGDVVVGLGSESGGRQFRVNTDGLDTYATVFACDSAGNVEVAASYGVNGTKVIGTQGAAVADATDAASVITQLNALLARVRAHGLIAT